MVLRSIIGKCFWLIPLLVVGIFLFRPIANAFETVSLVPAPAVNDELVATPGQTKTAVFAGGCFWGVQGVFQHVIGVTQAVSGYTGGARNTAEYEIVSTGKTGHAESVKITYDPSVITYGQLLQIYFSVVTDPTELNRQGPDHGTQYRSAIFFQNQQQENIARAYIAQLNKAGSFHDPVVTTLESFTDFYPAEAYHQNFLSLNPAYPYIAINDMPKVDNLKRLFPSLYREQAILVPAG